MVNVIIAKNKSKRLVNNAVELHRCEEAKRKKKIVEERKIQKCQEARPHIRWTDSVTS